MNGKGCEVLDLTAEDLEEYDKCMCSDDDSSSDEENESSSDEENDQDSDGANNEMIDYQVDDEFSSGHQFYIDVSYQNPFICFEIVLIIFITIQQESGHRIYEFFEIRLLNSSVEQLKRWNEDKGNSKKDRNFVKLLLLDTFGVKIMKVSSAGGGMPHNAPEKRHTPLDKTKLDFIRGYLFIYKYVYTNTYTTK